MMAHENLLENALEELMAKTLRAKKTREFGGSERQARVIMKAGAREVAEAIRAEILFLTDDRIGGDV